MYRRKVDLNAANSPHTPSATRTNTGLSGGVPLVIRANSSHCPGITGLSGGVPLVIRANSSHCPGITGPIMN